jgi:hypothetical protein
MMYKIPTTACVGYLRKVRGCRKVRVSRAEFEIACGGIHLIGVSKCEQKERCSAAARLWASTLCLIEAKVLCFVLSYFFDGL